MTVPSIGFTILYRWRLHPGKEQQFIEVWSRNTPEIIKRCGGLGSRLHKSEDGIWVAYAQWPDRATWEASYTVPEWDEAGSRLMEEAIFERLPRILLEPVADFLVAGSVAS